jgi:hypothetical protein
LIQILLGFWAFIKVGLLILFIVEGSLLIEEFIAGRLELRKGFAGAKSSPFRIFARHGLKLLRMEGSFSHHVGAGAKFLVIFLAAGLLPIWSGEIPLQATHGLWIFTALMIGGPVIYLILEWSIKKGSGWPSLLISAERTVGCSTVLLILTITLVAMSGLDNFSDFRDFQKIHGWIIFDYPLAMFILFAYAVANLFTSFQTIFSRTVDESPSGWSFDELLPHLRRAVWTLFLIDVFFSGSGAIGPAGNLFLVLKCLLLNVASYFGSQLFFHLREDQAEAFILWRLTPITVLILALTLLFPGGFF